MFFILRWRFLYGVFALYLMTIPNEYPVSAMYAVCSGLHIRDLDYLNPQMEQMACCTSAEAWRQIGAAISFRVKIRGFETVCLLYRFCSFILFYFCM